MFCLGVVFFSYLHPGMPSCDRVASVVVHSSASAFPKQTNYAGKYLLYVKTGGSTDSQLVHPADFTRVKAEMDGWRCKKDIRVKHPEFIEQGEQWLCLTPTLLNRMFHIRIRFFALDGTIFDVAFLVFVFLGDTGCSVFTSSALSMSLP